MKKILVVGAGTYQTPLIRRIVELGHRAYCVDRNENAPGFAYATGYRVLDVCDAPACLAYAQELGIDAVMTYGATLPLPTVAYIGKAMGLITLSPEAAEISKSKYKIKRRLADAGLNIKGDFFEMTDREEADRHRFTFPCVVKPSDGSGSKGVSVVRTAEQLPTALDYAFCSARYGEVYAEGFISGEEYSVEAFVNGEDVYVYAVVRSTFVREDNGDISYGHRTPSGLPEDTERRIAEQVKKAIHALGVTVGSANFDVILSDEDGQPYIIDVGIRVGQNLIASHLVPLSRGVNVMDNFIRLSLGEAVDLQPRGKQCIATRLLIYRPGRIREIKPMDDLIGTMHIRDIVLRKQVGDVLNPYKEKSDTCGWVVADGDTPEEAERHAALAKERLKDYILIDPIQE